MLPELLRIVGDIPGFEFVQPLVPRIGLQLGILRPRGGHAAVCEILQELQDLLRGFGHLPRQRVVGVALEAEQGGLSRPQRQDLFHDRAVVPLVSARTLVGGPGHIGGVHLLPQGSVVRVLHHRVIGGIIQREQPAFHAFLAGVMRGEGDGGFRQPLKGRAIADRPGPAVGRVEDVLLEFRLRL